MIYEGNCNQSALQHAKEYSYQLHLRRLGHEYGGSILNLVRKSEGRKQYQV